jgi:hypothetical protein
LVKCRDIRETDQRLQRFGRELRSRRLQSPQESHRAVASARTEESAYRGICKRRCQVLETAIVVTGQVATLREQCRSEHRVVALGNDREALLKRLPVEGSGRRNDRDCVATTESLWFMENRTDP